ncbi:MAG: hypothetical protein F6K42_02460 [Leptolyngbya sp. SIO1D8]|nr:hypothetical protein [Leptolyngbya sp. SIO1D8]
MWSPENPSDFSRFKSTDVFSFLDWFERTYSDEIALGVADAFVEGITQPYLQAISEGKPLPLWVEVMLRFRLAAQWAYENTVPIGRRISRNLAEIIPREQLPEYEARFKITPQDIADIPPEIRQAFVEGARFSLSWVKRLSDDARSLMSDLLAAETLKNRSPQDAIPLLERILRRDLVGKKLGVPAGLVTPEQVALWTLNAETKLLNQIAFRAQLIARTESMRMMNLGILTGLEQQGHKLAYIMPHSGSCPECRRLIDGRVFLIQVLKENLFRNFGVKKKFWVPALPQHPQCRHSAMAPPVFFRDALRGRVIPPQGIVLEWFGLPGGEQAMIALELSKPEEGWLTQEGAIG